MPWSASRRILVNTQPLVFILKRPWSDKGLSLLGILLCSGLALFLPPPWRYLLSIISVLQAGMCVLLLSTAHYCEISPRGFRLQLGTPLGCMRRCTLDRAALRYRIYYLGLLHLAVFSDGQRRHWAALSSCKEDISWLSAQLSRQTTMP